MNNFINNINKIIKKHYPIPISIENINTLSHFKISSYDYNKVLPFRMNIDGLILTGQYKNYKIIKVITNIILDWKKYLLLYISFLPNMLNPCVGMDSFLYKLHSFNYINFLNIKKLIIKNDNNDIIEYKIEYKNIIKEYVSKNITNIIINKNNHFYFESFSVCNNYKKLKIELDRLIKNRDKYSDIYFHLDNNGGGDIVPAHLIIRCLVGKKEKYMKNIKKLLTNKSIYEWDCWAEENSDSPNYEVVKQLNLDHLPNYDTKYNGKIFLYMNKQNGSAAWFFITYLIYYFSNKINRFSKKCYGKTIKYGTIESNQLKIFGHSATTSGDGNAITIKYNNNINIYCPTEQFLSCSIKKNDWNRFWIE